MHKQNPRFDTHTTDFQSQYIIIIAIVIIIMTGDCGKLKTTAAVDLFILMDYT